MTRPSVTPRRAGSALLLAVGLVFASAGAVWAVQPGVQIVITDSDGQTVDEIRVENLAPGDSTTHTIATFVAAPAGVTHVRLTADLRNLRDFENGCSRPEIEAGDDTCGTGPDQGELSQQLELSWLSGTYGTDGCELETANGPVGRLADLIGDDLELGVVAVAERACFGLGLHFLDLPENNLAQGDSAMFDLRVRASQVFTGTPGTPDPGGDPPIGGDDQPAPPRDPDGRTPPEQGPNEDQPDPDETDDLVDEVLDEVVDRDPTAPDGDGTDGDGTGDDAAAPPATDRSGPLPFTGAGALGLAVTGLLSLLAGLLLVRRRFSPSPS